MKAAILIDSTSGLSPQYLHLPNIFQVTLSTIFPDGSEYVDTPIEEQMVDFYRQLENDKELPTTSQPQPGQFYDVYDKIIKAGYDTVFTLMISAKLSGTYQTAYTVTQEYSDRLNIKLINSKSTSFAMEGMVINILNMIENGWDAEQIDSKMTHEIVEQATLHFTIGTLENLVKGGRVSALSGMLGNLLNIKPILKLGGATNGEAIVAEKVRTKKKALLRMQTLVMDEIEKLENTDFYIAICHSGALEEAESVHKALSTLIPNKKIRLGYVTPVLGTHAGIGAVGVCITPIIKF